MVEPFQKPWIIITIGFLFIVMILGEYLINDTLISPGPMLLIFTFIFVYWAFYPLKKNDIINEKIINRNIDLRLHNIQKNYEKGTHEVKRKMYYEAKGTYGRIIGTYMLVLLSNKDILIYQLKTHKTSDEKNTYFEFINKPELDLNSRFRKIIDKKKLTQRYQDWKLSTKTKLLLLLFSIILIGGTLTILIFYFSDFIEKKFIWYIILYILFIMFINSLNKKLNTKFFKRLLSIVSLPIMVVYLVSRLIRIHPAEQPHLA